MTTKTKPVTIHDFVFEYKDDEVIFLKEKALAYLLTAGDGSHILINSRKYVVNSWEDSELWTFGGPTIVVFVNCSDVFAWGTADTEYVTVDERADLRNELYRLLVYVLEDERWGATKFACWKRNLQPQKPMIDTLKKQGRWDEWWEALPPNPDQEASKK